MHPVSKRTGGGGLDSRPAGRGAWVPSCGVGEASEAGATGVAGICREEGGRGRISETGAHWFQKSKKVKE